MKVFSSVLMSCLLLAQLYWQPATAQNLSAADIPERLIDGANSVVRNDSRTFTIVSEDKMSIRVEYSITILNEKALPLAHLRINYREGERVDLNNAAIYNEYGIKTKTIRKSDMVDQSAVDNASLYNDSRIIFCRILPIKYPFTVVYDYETTYNRLYTFPTYSPYSSDNQSVEKSSLQLINHKNIPVNVKELNLPDNAVISKTNENSIWSFKNLLPIIEEPLEPLYTEIIPLIKVAPQIIQYDNYKGNSDSWESYGKWLAKLTGGRRSLSASTITGLKQMVSNTTSKREKVKILYKFLQSRTHYINISLGIGGIQPHRASEVDEVGYGDCKDLSNYMVALLEAIDIESFYTLVNSGKGEYTFISDLPCHQFDHIIVCVPIENDTIWLECTSQIMPFGYLGSFTDNRNVLIIKDESGFLAMTPEYNISDNYINSNISVEQNDEGTFAYGTISYSGLRMDDVVYYANQNQTDQIAWVNKNLEITDFSLISHKFKIYEDPKPSLCLNVEIALKSFFTGNNGRLFASLNMNNTISVPTRIRNRKRPLYIPYSFRNTDTLNIKLPIGYISEQLPESKITDERFGKYSMHIDIKDNVLTCIRTLEVYKGIHPPELYNAFYEFMQKSSIADSRQLVLIKE